jgi:glyoxylase-like metal-dependent hydrolase (beta-lactamase superfamily II)
MQTVAVHTLREWLEKGERVTVVDVRPPAERAEWHIPGSVHVNAYEALKAGDPGALAGVDLPGNAPVVTVCGAGRVSLVAAQQLRGRGLQALSLEGGMKAWSLAWNSAEVPLPESQARVLQVRRTGKGCLSYLIGSGAVAAVIDPSLPPEVYLELAGTRGWRIAQVLETHVHADHLSRARRLSELSKAELCLPGQQRVRFPFAALEDDSTLAIGGAELRVLRTPGHTLESACYLLDGGALFTGDTLFLGAVGRPDLRAELQEARARARLLCASLQRLLGLPARTLVLPGHTSEPVSFDHRPLCAPLGEVRARLDLLGFGAEAFVETLLARLPPTPPNYQRIVELNERGELPEDDPADLEAGANRCAIA